MKLELIGKPRIFHPFFFFLILFSLGCGVIGLIGSWTVRVLHMEKFILMPHPVMESIINYLVAPFFLLAPLYVLWIAFKQRKG